MMDMLHTPHEIAYPRRDLTYSLRSTPAAIFKRDRWAYETKYINTSAAEQQHARMALFTLQFK